jgi:hypothetical protein
MPLLKMMKNWNLRTNYKLLSEFLQQNSKDQLLPETVLNGGKLKEKRNEYLKLSSPPKRESELDPQESFEEDIEAEPLEVEEEKDAPERRLKRSRSQ